MNGESGYEQVSAEDLLEHEGIEYRATSGSRGPQFNIKTCPACGGDKWKVYLSQDTGYGNCFHGSCGESFNLWTFAKAHLQAENKAVGELFDRIAGQGGWKPKRRGPRPEVKPALDGALKLPTSLPVPDAGFGYLNDRGVSVKMSRDFGLRMCLDGAFRCVKEDGSTWLQAYSGRLLIPIYDLAGQLVTFQGRDTTGKLEPKYLFPPRLPSTGRFLYNGHRALAERWEHVVMGEGAFDVWAIQEAVDTAQLPSTGAVGSFGKKLTMDTSPGAESQLQALLKLKSAGLKRITIMWDGERDALASAVETAERLTKLGFEVYLALLPQGKDPADVHVSTRMKSIARALPYSRSLAIRLRLKCPYA